MVVSRLAMYVIVQPQNKWDLAGWDNHAELEITILYAQTMNLDLKSLELFVRVAALGAIGRAGAELGMSRTAATQRIQELEKLIGSQLLHRTTRSVSLSVDGELFLAHANRILENVDTAISDLQLDPKTMTGELRVASSASFGRKVLAPCVADFLDLHPKLSVQLHLSDAPFDIIENGFDLAVRLGDPSPSTLMARRVGESPRVTVATPAYLERHGTPKTPSDLQHHNCLIRSDLRVWTFRCPDGRTEDVRVTGNFSTNLAEAVTEATLLGVGVSRKCVWEIASHLESGDLVRILPNFTVLPEWSVYTVRSPSRTIPARTRTFINFVAKWFSVDAALNKQKS